MSTEAPAFQAQGFLLGQAMARGLPSKKRVTAGVLLAISPNPIGMAATLSMVRSARRAQRAADDMSDGTKGGGNGGSSGSSGGPPPPPPAPPPPPVVDPETRSALVQDTKDMLGAVADAAGAVGDAARQSAETQAKMLALLSGRDVKIDVTAPPPPSTPRKSS